MSSSAFRFLDSLRRRDWVSGQTLAAELDISRTAVWKRIEKLRSLGYTIEAQTGRGYRLGQEPDYPFAELVMELLGPDESTWQVEFMTECTSTNTLLKARGQQGASEGVVLVADYQSAGRGRRGRTWLAEAGNALLFSVLLRPELPPSRLPLLTLAAGVAVGRVLRELGVPCGLKWPNDILVDDRKICGILAEISAESDHTDYVVLGIGLNVRNAPQGEGISATALDLYISPPGRAELLAQILMELGVWYRHLCDESTESITAAWQALSATIGHDVVAFRGDEEVRGLALSLTADGSLLLDTVQGPVVINAGEISLRHRNNN